MESAQRIPSVFFEGKVLTSKRALSKYGIDCFLSTGTIAKKFATTISQLSECGNILAVASRQEETAKQFAIEYQISKAYTNYRELVYAFGI